MDTSDRQGRDAPTESFMDYIGIIRRQRWLVLGITVSVVSLTMFLSFGKQPTYQAQARVLVRPTSNAPEALFAINLDTERGLAASASVADVVRENIDSQQTSAQLLQNVSVQLEPGTEILQIHYASPDPKMAAVMANAFANSYLKFRRGEALAQFQLQAEDLKERIAILNDQKQAISRRLAKTRNPTKQSVLVGDRNSLEARTAVLESSLAALGDPQSLSRSGGEIVQVATVPTTPSSPNHSRDAMFAIMLGLIMGIGAALMKDRFDPRLHGSSDLEGRLGAPVLATIPAIEKWRNRDDTEIIITQEPNSPAAEAYRALRTNLQYLARTNGTRVIAITSPFQGEGKTTTVANLAVVLSQADKRVIAVSCDLRRPRLHRFFGMANDVGVTTVLAGMPVNEAIQRPPGLENVLLMASGPVPPNPAELLGSDAMEDLMDTLRSVADYVLLDLPPLLAVADGLVLGPQSDGVLVVVDASATARGAAASLRTQLEQVGGHIIGSVFNNFNPDTSKTYTYDYRVRYPYAYEGYESHPEEANESPEPEEEEPSAPSRN